jgi:sigma-B regulation protein RsbU (phosphoserine phosphatase)
MKNFMRNLRIGTKILAVILIVSLFSLFFVSAVSYIEMLNLTRYSTDANTRLGINSSEKSREALKSQAEEYIVKIAREQALKCDATLAKVQSEVSSVADYLSSLYRNRKNCRGRKLPMVQETVMGQASSKYMLAPQVTRTPELEKELLLISNAEYVCAPVFTNNPILNNIYLGTTTGISYRYSKSNAYNPQYDPRERGWYKSAMLNPNLPAWVDTYLDTYGSICVTTARTFADETGRPRGVVASDITLKSMQDDILSMKIGKTGYAFLLDNTGKIIAHPKYGEGLDTKPLENATGDYRQAIQNIVEHQEGLTTAHVDGKLSYIAYSKFPTTEWSLAVVMEVAEIIQPAEETRMQIDEYTSEAQTYITKTLSSVLIRLVVILAISAMVILVLSYLISKTITTPVKQLVEKVTSIGKGNLDVWIDDQGKDEIAELARAFNKMTADLKTYIANLSRVTAEKERISAELDVARKIQESMLPCIFPPFPERDDFEIFATMIPAKEVGGDFYDFFFVDGDHLAVVIADVSGKGVSAALFMVISKTLIQNSTQSGKRPGDVFETVNNQLCKNNGADMFVTAFMGILQISTGEFVYTNAGHNPPLLKTNDGEFQWLPTEPGFVLASMEDFRFSEKRIRLGEGDVLFLYTDGVTEAANTDNDLYSDNRLIQELNANKDQNVVDLLKSVRVSIADFAGEAEQSDDITMLALRVGKNPNATQFPNGKLVFGRT